MKKVDFDENNFIIGIDLGNSTSNVSYFDFNQMNINIVDASGGYGKTSIPTLVSYNLDSDEWIFGEYALLNKGFGNDIIFENIIENLGKNLEYTINNKKIKLSYILSKYLLFLVDNIKNINPNAIIKGIVLSISSYKYETFISELEEAFKFAELNEQLIKIVDDKECILKSYLYEHKLDGNKVFIIDYSNRQIRASLYEMKEKGKFFCLKSMFRNDIGQGKIYNTTKILITNKFFEETGKTQLNINEQNQIDIFTNQQFDIIFHKANIENIKLYYNFYYPPFQKTITKEEIFSIISYFEQELNSFFNDFFNDINISEKDICNLILTGGGIEIDFIIKFIKSRFFSNKNFKGTAKRTISDGACIIACQELGIISKDWIEIEDLNRIKNNIGIFINKCGEDKFLPLIYKNSFICQESNKQIFNLDVEEKLDFDIFIEENNEYKSIYNVNIALPENLKRDKKTIRFVIEMKFNDINEIIFIIEDFGFGDIFPKTDFKEKFIINIKDTKAKR